MLLHVIVRPATAADAEAISDVYLVSRKRFMPYAPVAHTDESVRLWIRTHLVARADLSVACIGDRIVGFMALTRDQAAGWIDQLYLHPDVVARGIGTRFVGQAKEQLGSPIRLYTFQDNLAARRFYERHGFAAIAFGDGSANEENCPDVLYEWREG